MRLIDADALKRQIQEAYCAECDDYNGIRCRACSIDDALIQVDAAPTIDAIPVEWPRHRLMMAQKNGSAHPEQAIQYVLWLWEQQKDGEQEAHGT